MGFVEVKFALRDLHCAYCEEEVLTALRSLPGVFSCQLDLDGKSADITYDPTQVSEEDFYKAIETTGYHAGH